MGESMTQDATAQSDVFIYGLFDPRDQKIRYVGKSKNPYARRDNHLAEARMRKRRGGRRLNWLRELSEAKVNPGVVILECVRGPWEEREKTWIAALPGLLNSHPGGAGSWAHLTLEQRVMAGRKGGTAGKGVLRCSQFCEKQRNIGVKDAQIRLERLHAGRRGSSKVVEHCRRIAFEREERRRIATRG